jgi:hypothetical protein
LKRMMFGSTQFEVRSRSALHRHPPFLLESP